MLPLASAAPTTAERIRSACVRASGALLALERWVEGAAGEDPVATPIHHLLADGSFAVAVPLDRRLPTDEARGSQALLELTDYAPLPLREPVRSLVWVRGQLKPVPAFAVTQTLDLIAELREGSSEFAELWERHDVSVAVTLCKTFDHPRVGPVPVNCTWRAVVAADQSIVSDPPPPSMPPDSVAPLVNRKTSAPAPPARLAGCAPLIVNVSAPLPPTRLV